MNRKMFLEWDQIGDRIGDEQNMNLSWMYSLIYMIE